MTPDELIDIFLVFELQSSYHNPSFFGKLFTSLLSWQPICKESEGERVIERDSGTETERDKWTKRKREREREQRENERNRRRN